MKTVNSFKWTKKQDQWVDVNIQVKNDTNLIIQRDWQKRSSQELSDKKYWILNAPTGSGKSLEISCLAIEKLKRNPKLRVVIAVPQLIISNGFKDLKNIQLGDEIINWGLRHDFCNGLGKDNSGDLLNFLKRKSYDNSYKDRIAIVTHKSLIIAFDKNNKLFEDLLLIVDEAHHCEFGDVENTLQVFDDFYTEDEKFSHNRLGSVIKYATEHTNDCEIGLVTATFFRGDNTGIIPIIYKDMFYRFNYFYDEYLKDCKYLKNISFDFTLYPSDFLEPMMKLFELDIMKTIVYIPSVNSNVSMGKDNDVYRVYQAISQCQTPEVEEGIITYVKRGDQKIKVVNLVDIKNRKEKVDIFNKDSGYDSKEIDVIIALGMFKEGADWVYADRSIIVGQRNSLNEMIQMMGRLFRDIKDKDSVYIHQLIPASINQINVNDTRSVFNNYLNTIFLNMAIEELINPIPIKISKLSNIKNIIDESIEDEYNFADLQKEIIIKFIRELSENPNIIGNHDLELSTINNIIYDMYSDVFDQDAINQFSESIYKKFQTKTLKMLGFDMTNIDYDIITDYSIADFIIKYFGEAFDISKFDEIKKIYYKYSPLAVAMKYARDNKINNYAEWVNDKNRPETLPASGYNYYKVSIDYFFEDRNKFASLEVAMKFARDNDIDNHNQWVIFENKPKNLPHSPRYYKIDIDLFFEGRNKTEYYSLEEAMEFARDNNINSKRQLSKIENKKMPYMPHHYYKVSLDYFFEGRNKNIFLSLEKAMKFARDNNINNYEQFKNLKNRPKNIPAKILEYYKVSNDYFFEGRNKNEFLSLEDAMKYARINNINSLNDWMNNKNRPKNLPHSAYNYYKVDIDYFFEGRNKYRSFTATLDMSMKFARDNKINNYAEWVKFKNRPKEFPYTAHHHYKVSMDHFFEGRNKNIFLSLEEAMKFARDNNINNPSGWTKMKHRPKNLPSMGHIYYNVSIAHFYEGRNKNIFLSLEKSMKFARDNNINSSSDWNNIKNRASNLPAHPHLYYKVSLDYFYEGRNLPIKYMSLEEAMKFARDNDIDNHNEWLCFENKPKNLPQYTHYKVSADYFFEGRDRYLSLEESMKYARINKINNANQWANIKNRPKNIPSSYYYYNVSVNHFFEGRNKNIFLSLEEAMKFARDNNINTGREWRRYKNIPKNLPRRDPYHFYGVSIDYFFEGRNIK